MSKFSKKLEVLKADGVLVLPSKVEISKLKLIKDEVKFLSKLTFNDVLGALVISENYWIEHLGVHSELILKTILDEELLSLADNFFGESSILGSIKYQKKIKTHKALNLHSDKGPGLVAFLFLNDVDNVSGATRFLKGTHLIDYDNYPKESFAQITDYFNPRDFKDFESITVAGGAGTVVVFSQRILHDLPKIRQIGREIIWFTFYPESFSYLSENHLLSKNIILSLNEDQRSRVLFENVALGPSFLKFGNGVSISETHEISKIRTFYYVLFYKLSSFFRALFNIS